MYFDVDGEDNHYRNKKFLPDTCADCCFEYFAINSYLDSKKTDLTKSDIYKEIKTGLLIKKDVSVENQKTIK